MRTRVRHSRSLPVNLRLRGLALRANAATTDDIAEQLRSRGHDVLAVVGDPGLIGLPDSGVLAHATSENRLVVTKNITDFMVLDAHCRASGSPHAGLVLVSTKTFPEDRNVTGALVRSLDKLLSQGSIDHGAVIFLQR